jgi:hypothetical protein
MRPDPTTRFAAGDPPPGYTGTPDPSSTTPARRGRPSTAQRWALRIIGIAIGLVLGWLAADALGL